jgi:hypothetical protein
MRGNSLFRNTKSIAEDQAHRILVSDRLPKLDQEVIAFCIDHRGIYKLPYHCFFDGADWVNATTDEDVHAQVYAWMPST